MVIDYREGKGKKYIDVRNIDGLLPICTLTGDRSCNLGVCPDWELNPQPLWCTAQQSNQLSATGQS